jgi:hypothetical protein
MHRMTPLLVLAISGSAHAAFEGMMNPMLMMNPATAMNPMGMMSPMPMMMPPMGMTNPMMLAPAMGMGMPMGGMGGALFPAMQLAPNVLSFGHNMSAFGNPYMGSPFGSMPMPTQGLPFAIPGWGNTAPSFPPASAFPPVQSPFAAPAQMAPQPASPGMLPFAMPMPMPQAVQPAAPSATPQPVLPATASGMPPIYFDPAAWLNMMAPSMPSPQPASTPK